MLGDLKSVINLDAELACCQLELVVLESGQPEKEIGPMKKRFTEEQIIGLLREADTGLPVKEVCREARLQ